MKNIVFINREDLQCILSDTISLDVLFERFYNHNNDTIYVLDGGKLTGCITFGDFKRNQDNVSNAVSKKFQKLNQKNKFLAKNIFFQNKNIRSIPVADEFDHLLGAYVLQDDLSRYDTQLKNSLEFLVSDDMKDIINYKGYKKIILFINENADQNFIDLTLGKLEISIEYIVYKNKEQNLNQLDIEITTLVLNLDFMNGRMIEFYFRNISFNSFVKDCSNLLEFAKRFHKCVPAELELIANRLKDYGKIIVLKNDYFMHLLADFFARWNIPIKVIHAKDISFKNNKYYLNGGIKDENAILLSPLPYEIELNYNNKKLFNITQVLFDSYKEYDNGLKLIESLEYLKSEGINIKLFTLPSLHDIISVHKKAKEKFNQLGYFGDTGDFGEEFIENFLEDLYSKEYADIIMNQRLIVQNINGIPYLADKESKYFNCANGFRATLYEPDKYVNKIYCFGRCYMLGSYVEDSQTIPSLIQKRINELYPNTYKVVNCGIWAFIVDKMRDLDFHKGDMIFVLENQQALPNRSKVPFHNLTKLFLDTENIERYYTDLPNHFNHIMNRLIANEFMNQIEECGHIPTKCLPADQKTVNFRESLNETQKFRDYLVQLSKADHKKKENGAIVVNCNPFTLGHRFLVEYAANQVDWLYVFVVEENLSVFDFSERFRLVEKGTEDIKNITVISSGNYILSKDTFPEYFEKEVIQGNKVDSTKDIQIFAELIAPILNISYRFVGEEIQDEITRQYNETMKSLLPQYGIKVVEISRKVIGDKVISASYVRKMLMQNNFEEIKKYVPASTYEYLADNFGGI